VNFSREREGGARGGEKKGKKIKKFYADLASASLFSGGGERGEKTGRRGGKKEKKKKEEVGRKTRVPSFSFDHIRTLVEEKGKRGGVEKKQREKEKKGKKREEEKTRDYREVPSRHSGRFVPA